MTTLNRWFILYNDQRSEILSREENGLPRGTLAPTRGQLAVFDFWIIRDDLEKEFEALIQYDQPIIEVDRKEMVFLCPVLTNYEKYEKEMGLRRDSFLISFESYGGTTLLLAHQVTQTERSKPTLISVTPATP